MNRAGLSHLPKKDTKVLITLRLYVKRPKCQDYLLRSYLPLPWATATDKSDGWSEWHAVKVEHLTAMKEQRRKVRMAEKGLSYTEKPYTILCLNFEKFVLVFYPHNGSKWKTDISFGKLKHAEQKDQITDKHENTVCFWDTLVIC